MPMGFPLSLIIADLIMQDLENEIFGRVIIYFYLRYLCWWFSHGCSQITSVDTILKHFNSYHRRLQFTIEIGKQKNKSRHNDHYCVNGIIIFDWFYKSTFSGRYLNYLSQHSLCQKKRNRDKPWQNIFTFAFNVSPEKFEIHYQYFIDYLRDYPINFIFYTSERLKCLINNIKLVNL